ncbi:Tectonin beta-propeller repeat-containing protein 2 WD repeat-containing protein KIAA0329/KIAA0297 [Collichthys lucidus]|uniref:Tectonin beta-propeller repeat-containing protein 2 WD repeat-containing protein KIAA0329/KIAA0297 n=1 Tax=Collichthys lucidus TaxID=240159 RepID=A0A4U5VE47_COLLU|nr:Tectonin beta-propeller repeat-containing protein 2 WD repeat-containing protein KIAA0329/KIAA0297 [Collichthys lucidus]
MKLFSGDDKGRVVFSSLDLDQGVCKPVLLLEESSGVVQVEYSHQVLLVSTQQRSLLYCTQKQEVQQLGTKPRKSSGRFGACFLPGLCKQSDLQVFAARPGLRLWRSDIRGQVEDTRLLKPLFNTQFELFPRPGPIGAYRPSDRQLGLLTCFLREGWIVSWNEYSIYVLDCLNEPIRTMAIIVEGGGGWLATNKEVEEEEEVEEAEEQLESPWKRLSDYFLRAGLKALQRSARTRRGARDSSSGTRLSESSCSDSMFVVQDGSCSDGGSGTPQSDRASLIGMDLQNQDSPEPEQEQEPQEMGGLNRGVKGGEEVDSGSLLPPGSLLFQSLENQRNQGKGSGPCPDAEVVPPTPDVDLLLECTFSYMHNTEEEDGQEQQPMEEQEDEFLSPLIGPEEKEEEEDEELAPPTGPVDHMFYSTVSTLDRKPSLSSDEDGDIYRHTPPPAGCGGDVHKHLTNQTDKTTDAQVDQDAEDRDTHKPDQLAESWMGYSGPGCGILSLQVTDRFVWCLDFKGGLFCSTLPETGLNWQRFEDNVHQVAVSPSGNLLWKVEQKSLTAFACAKVSIKGKRHWYKAVEQTAFVALSDDSAWIIRTNGDLYLQTGTFWQNVVPRGTVSATRWTFITSSAVPHREGDIPVHHTVLRPGLQDSDFKKQGWRNVFTARSHEVGQDEAESKPDPAHQLLQSKESA